MYRLWALVETEACCTEQRFVESYKDVELFNVAALQMSELSVHSRALLKFRVRVPDPTNHSGAYMGLLHSSLQEITSQGGNHVKRSFPSNPSSAESSKVRSAH